MGKGDKKTKRGKITNGSYGKTRLRNKPEAPVAAPKAEKPAKEKAEPKPKATKAKAKPKAVETEAGDTTINAQTEE